MFLLLHALLLQRLQGPRMDRLAVQDRHSSMSWACTLCLRCGHRLDHGCLVPDLVGLLDRLGQCGALQVRLNQADDVRRVHPSILLDGIIEDPRVPAGDIAKIYLKWSSTSSPLAATYSRSVGDFISLMVSRMIAFLYSRHPLTLRTLCCW